MPDRYEVTCINKLDRENPHERITHIGGTYPNRVSWKLTEEEAIASIESGFSSYYVKQGGKEVEVVIDERNGRKYLRTDPDDTKENNLLSLEDCP